MKFLVTVALAFLVPASALASDCLSLQGKWACRPDYSDKVHRYFDINLIESESETWEIGWNYSPPEKGNDLHYSTHRCNEFEYKDGYFLKWGSCSENVIRMLSTRTQNDLPDPGYFEEIYTLVAPGVLKIEFNGLGPTGEFICSPTSW